MSVVLWDELEIFLKMIQFITVVMMISILKDLENAHFATQICIMKMEIISKQNFSSLGMKVQI